LNFSLSRPTDFRVQSFWKSQTYCYCCSDRCFNAIISLITLMPKSSTYSLLFKVYMQNQILWFGHTQSAVNATVQDSRIKIIDAPLFSSKDRRLARWPHSVSALGCW